MRIWNSSLNQGASSVGSPQRQTHDPESSRLCGLGISYSHLIMRHFALGITYKHVESDWKEGMCCGNLSEPRTAEYGGSGWDLGISYRGSHRVSDTADLVIRAAVGERSIGRLKCNLGCYHTKYEFPRSHFIGIGPSLYALNRDVAFTAAFERGFKDRTLGWMSRVGFEIVFWDDMAPEVGDVERHILTLTLVNCDQGIDIKSLLARYVKTYR